MDGGRSIGPQRRVGRVLMTDTELHGVACLRKIRELCEAAKGEADDLAGWIRKIHQTAGYGLTNMKASDEAVSETEAPVEKLVTPKVAAAMEKMKRASAEKPERIGSAGSTDPAGVERSE